MKALTTGPKASQKFPLTDEARIALDWLYLKDGAWTRTEAISHLGEGQFRAFPSQHLLGRQDTDMGAMYHLLARGRIAVYGGSDASVSLQSQLDQAYVRLSLKQLGWQILTEGQSFYKGYADLFPKIRFTEASSTTHGRVLVAGKITGGGYSVEGIRRIINTVRSSTLSYSFTVVILTPHPRRGLQIAERHRNIIQVIHVLPRIGQTSRFTPVRPPTNLPNQEPFYSPTSIEVLRSNQALPDLSLSILALTRPERIEHAQAALDVDRALSESQLQRHYGLSPFDLTGRLSTSAIVRPVKGRSATEVQQEIVVADRKVARLDDGDLVHRLTTAQIRLQLGIPANPERWVVESRGNLPVEEPDAIYIDADGEQHAIEADTGHYSMTTVLRKLESFHDQSYQGTVWGTLSNTRIKNLARQIGTDRQPRFLNVQWWP